MSLYWGKLNWQSVIFASLQRSSLQLSYFVETYDIFIVLHRSFLYWSFFPLKYRMKLTLNWRFLLPLQKYQTRKTCLPLYPYYWTSLYHSSNFHIYLCYVSSTISFPFIFPWIFHLSLDSFKDPYCELGKFLFYFIETMNRKSLKEFGDVV